LKSLGYDVKMPKAAFYLWIKIPPRYNGDSKKFADELLEKSGIVLVPGEAFGDLGKGYVRISVVASDENLDNVIERMKLDGFQY
ncbi:MAG: aminotransferase class I/II-fold pyridoxal phosphate-dependent enzyme, partial [bacterium]|nr:aminotransferase class I/II-fold pyridoxal phosphate-dependent enzyme [bacterium]